LSAEVDQRREAEAALRREQTRTLALEQQLGHARRLEAIGRLAGGVAHDFNNLLTVTLAYTGLLRDDLNPRPESERAEFLDGIDDCTQRATRLTRQLLTFAGRQHVKVERLELAWVVRKLMPLLRRLIRDDIQMALETPEEGAWVEADLGQIEQAVVNLVANAANALPAGGNIGIAVERLCADDVGKRWPNLKVDTPQVRLTVSDDGAGIDPELLPKIFEPFFTTRSEDGGTGLGLASVHGFVHQAQGEVRVSSTLGVGTRFDILLPAMEAPHIVARRPTRPSVPLRDLSPPHRPTVLICDDNHRVRSSVGTMLRSRGFLVRETEGGQSALGILSSDSEVSVLVSDVVMPRMGGPELAARARELRPQLPVVFIAGYAGEVGLGEVMETPATELVNKPFTSDALVDVIERLLREQRSVGSAG